MFRVVVACLLLAFPAAAQEPDEERERQPMWGFWVRGSGQIYENFFQAGEGQPEESVFGIVGEAGASRAIGAALTAYGQVSYVHFDDETLEGSPGVRFGLRGGTRPHAFDVFAEYLDNRPSFELDEFVGADIRRISGEYSYRFLEDWQVSVDGDLDQLQSGGDESRDSDFAGVGAAVRWRGSRVFSPELGFRIGERDVNDATQTYDQAETYLQIRSQTTEKLYLSFRIRNRTREYQNIDREDDRFQLSLSADYALGENLTLNFYGSQENIDTSVPGRDFDWGMWSAGVTYRF